MVHSSKQQTTRFHCTQMAQSPNTSQGGASLSSKVLLTSMNTVQPIRSQPPVWQWRWMQSPMPSTGLPPEVMVGPHMPSSPRFNEPAKNKLKMKHGTGSPDANVLIVDIHLWKLQWMSCPGHAGVKRTDPAGKATITNGFISEDLKCWGAWDTKCGNRVKDITPSITWRREA